MLKTVSSVANAIGALNYKGTWNAATNTPAIASGVGTQGDYYVVSVAGATDLDGITNWGIGDWATFNGSVWQRVEGGADGNFVNLTATGTATITGLSSLNGGLEVTGLSTLDEAQVDSININDDTIGFYRDDPTIGTGNQLGVVQWGGADGGNTSNAAIKVVAGSSNWTVSSTPTDIQFWTTDLGSDTSRKVITIDEDGNLNLDSGSGNPILNITAAGGGGAAQITLASTGYTSAIYQYQGSVYHSTASIRPAVDNSSGCGGPSHRWTTVYAVTGTINTSDAREKTAVAGLTANELEASKLLSKEIGTYKWLASIEEKGEGARTHIGMTVQRAIEIMESCNLDPMAYGFICYDEWEDQFIDRDAVPATDDTEAVDAWTEQLTTAGNRYGFRYDQLNQFIAAGFNARLEALEA